MSRDETRDQMLEAVESEAGFEALRDVVTGLLDSGATKEELLEDLSQIRKLVDEETEDLVLDVMDLLEGWCAPSARLD
jgi:hypothetical protein